MFDIEQNVPVPAVRVQSKYPFRDMEVGDSFLIPIGEDDEATLICNRVSTAARAAAKALAFGFTTRKTSKGVRVWRVA